MSSIQYHLATLFLATLFLATLALPALSSPTPQTTNPVPSVHKSQCVSRGTAADIEWGIYVINTTMPSDQGSGSWGGGLLDNVRAANGCNPTSWQAVLDSADPQGVGVTFNTPLTCQTNQIVDAVHAASREDSQYHYGEGQWVYCEGDTLLDWYEGTKNVDGDLTLGDVKGLLGGFGGCE